MKKIYPKKAIFKSLTVAAISLVSMSGCKKNSGTTDTNSTTTGTASGYVKTATNTNPLTASATCDYDVSDTAYTNHGWTKTFDDEFTNLSNWGAITGGVQNELECNEPANVLVANGFLNITAKQQTVTGPKLVGNDTTASFGYTSGWITSKATFSASSATPKVRIVARIKVAAGYGLSSIFSAYGEGNWPLNGEIDMLENQGYDVKNYAVDYDYGTTVNKDVVTDGLMFNPVNEDLSACYHVYVMEWTQTSLNAYLDGNLVESTSGTYVPQLFGKAMHLSLSVPIAGLYYGKITSAIQGCTMSVDYVKVFTSN
jgi:hypothetical protein